MKPVKMAIAGVGGWGHAHIRAIGQLEGEGLAQLEACAEPNIAAPAIEALKARGVRHYVDYATMLEAEEDLELVSIVTPIPFHYTMTMAAFERGLHVFLEKPPAVRIQDLRRMIALQENREVYCAVNFHDMARPAVIALKDRLTDGAIGPVRSIRVEARWQRDENYYRRNSWAGMLKVEEGWALDGPVNNSNAHSLNMAAYFAGPTPHEWAYPIRVQGELYHANPIESEDTSCLRADTDAGVEILAHLTQCAARNHPRTARIIGESGEAWWQDGDGITINGQREDFSQAGDPLAATLRRLIEVIRGSDEPLFMPLAETEPFVLLSNGAYESAGQIHAIDERCIREEIIEGHLSRIVEGIETLVEQGQKEGKLFSELGAPWGRAAEPFDLTNYTGFPQRFKACE